MLDSASFDTSSHHTIDYLVETASAKSFTFGIDSCSRYPHLKKQVPKKRSLSVGNFNWNMMVDRVNKRLEREQKKYDTFISGQPMQKLLGILGQELLNRIREDYPELFELIMNHIQLKRNISFNFVREVLAQYNINLEEERRWSRMSFGNEHR